MTALIVYYKPNSDKLDTRCNKRKMWGSTHHLEWRKQKGQALYPVSTFHWVWYHCFLITFSTFLFHHIFIFKNRLKSFNLSISIFLLDCILPSFYLLSSHTPNPFLFLFAKYNSKNQEPFLRLEDFSFWFESNISVRFCWLLKRISEMLCCEVSKRQP